MAGKWRTAVPVSINFSIARVSRLHHFLTRRLDSIRADNAWKWCSSRKSNSTSQIWNCPFFFFSFFLFLLVFFVFVGFFCFIWLLIAELTFVFLVSIVTDLFPKDPVTILGHRKVGGFSFFFFVSFSQFLSFYFFSASFGTFMLSHLSNEIN